MADPAQRAGVLAQVAVARARTGDVAGGERLLRSVGPPTRQELREGYRNLALAAAGAGDRVVAVRTAAVVAEEDAEHVWCHVAFAQARAHDVPGAIATAAKIVNPNMRSMIARDVAAEQASAGDPAAALATAAAIPVPSSRHEALRAVAAACRRLGDREGERRASAELDAAGRSEVPPDQMLVDDLLAAAGMREDAGPPAAAGAGGIASVCRRVLLMAAWEAAGRISAPPGPNDFGDFRDARRDAQLRVLLAQARAGETGTAVAGADALPWRAMALGEIAVVRAEAGDVDGAMAAAAQADHADYQHLAYTKIATACVNRGDRAAASRALDALETMATREVDVWTDVLFDVSYWRAAAGDAAGAKRACDRIALAAGGISDPRSRAMLYLGAGLGLKRCGEAADARVAFAAARRSAAATEEPGQRDLYFGYLVRDLSRAGEFTEATAAVEAIEGVWERAAAWRKVAVALATAGDDYAARAAVDRIANTTEFKVQACCEIAGEIAKQR